MIHVVLRSGKVLRYNNGAQCCVEDGTITIRDSHQRHFLIARLPMDVVERAEFCKPCAVLREVKDIRKKKRY